MSNYRTHLRDSMEMRSFGIQPILLHRFDRLILPDYWHCAWNPVLAGGFKAPAEQLSPLILN
jgi:hypothetical protein